jgi:hypothetical protein
MSSIQFGFPFCALNSVREMSSLTSGTRPGRYCVGVSIPAGFYLLLLLADFFFLTDLVVGLTAAFVAAFFVPNTESQFLENSGVGAVRTMGPDIVD